MSITLRALTISLLQEKFLQNRAGPHTWTHVAPAAKGLHQSPVDIETSGVQFDPDLAERPLEIRYIAENSKSLVNNGHSVQVNIAGEDSRKDALPKGSDIIRVHP